MDFIWYLDKFNAYGWLLLVFVLERLFPTRKINFLNRGWVYDLIHMYEPYVRYYAVGLATLFLVPYMAHVPGHGFLADKNTFVNIVVLVLVSEATFYWMHRLMHRVPFLWEFHRVHHSSTTYYSLMTTRFHFIDIALFTVPYMVIGSWLGTQGEVLMGMSVFQGFWDRYGHSNVRGPRFTGYLLGNPHFHAWHHSNAIEARDKNFSRDFVFMDYIFGTAYYPKDKTASDFGDPQFPVNYFTQQLMPFWNLGRKAAGKFRPAQPVASSAPVATFDEEATKTTSP